MLVNQMVIHEVVKRASPDPINGETLLPYLPGALSEVWQHR